MKYLLSVFLTILLFTIVACKKKYTETYYFNCKINGQYFEPEKQGGLGEYPLTAILLYNDTDLRISADKGIQNVYIGIKDTLVVKTKEYLLSNNAMYYSRALYSSNLSGNHYETDSVYTGKTNITKLDKTNMTVEGTFSFTAYNPVLLDTVIITDGNFKLKYSLN